MNRRPVVTIVVSGGMAEVHRAPAGIDVRIVDFDNDPAAILPEREAALPRLLTVMGRKAHLARSRSRSNACLACNRNIPIGVLNYIVIGQNRLHFCLACAEKANAMA